MNGAIDTVDRRIAGWMSAHGVGLMRLSLGIVFVWFGALPARRLGSLL